MSNRARVVGVHPVAADERVHLVELEIEGTGDDFDIGAVTQELLGQPHSNWQAVYDEQEVGRNAAHVRFAFFFHNLDFDKPLLSSVGPLDLPRESPMPKHLRDIQYEEP
jgi:hypothetical protein